MHYFFKISFNILKLFFKNYFRSVPASGGDTSWSAQHSNPRREQLDEPVGAENPHLQRVDPQLHFPHEQTDFRRIDYRPFHLVGHAFHLRQRQGAGKHSSQRTSISRFDFDGIRSFQNLI